MSFYEQKPEINVPPGWNAEKDFEHYDDVFGVSNCPLYPEALCRIFESSTELSQVVQATLGFFLRRDGPSVTLGSMSMQAQLSFLRELVENRTVGTVRDRLIQDITRCEQVNELRDLLLTRHLKNPEGVWLYELGGLSDWIVTAWSILLETVQIELGHCTGWSPKARGFTDFED